MEHRRERDDVRSFILAEVASTTSWERTRRRWLQQACSGVLSVNRIRLPNSSSRAPLGPCRRCGIEAKLATVVLAQLAETPGPPASAKYGSYLAWTCSWIAGVAGERDWISVSLRRTWRGLVEASRLLVVQSIGVTADKTALFAEDDLVVSKAVRPGKACLSTTLLAVLCCGEELG